MAGRKRPAFVLRAGARNKRGRQSAVTVVLPTFRQFPQGSMAALRWPFSLFALCALPSGALPLHPPFSPLPQDHHVVLVQARHRAHPLSRRSVCSESSLSTPVLDVTLSTTRLRCAGEDWAAEGHVAIANEGERAGWTTVRCGCGVAANGRRDERDTGPSQGRGGARCRLPGCLGRDAGGPGDTKAMRWRRATGARLYMSLS
jgi:hypothetical protein